jgi:glucose dehydrogenase
MRASRLVAAVILALVGLVWIGQGVGLIGGSAMSGSSFWAVVGVVLLALAAIIVLWERRRTPAA